MIRSILATAAVLTMSPASFAGPAVSMSIVQTPYGQFGCMQRAQNKFFGIGATRIRSDVNSVWGHLNDTTIGVWCRGQEAFIVTAGDNVNEIRDEVRNAF